MVSLPENISQSIHNDLINILSRDPVRIALMEEICCFGQRNNTKNASVRYAVYNCLAKQYKECQLVRNPVLVTRYNEDFYKKISLPGDTKCLPDAAKYSSEWIFDYMTSNGLDCRDWLFKYIRHNLSFNQYRITQRLIDDGVLIVVNSMINLHPNYSKTEYSNFTDEKLTQLQIAAGIPVRLKYDSQPYYDDIAIFPK